MHLPDEAPASAGGRALRSLLCRRGRGFGDPPAEFEYGVVCSGEKQSHNRAALDQFLQEIPVAVFDAGSARSNGPARQATRERKRDALDKLIAASAMALGVILVTNNEADFAAFPGLVVENWVSSH